MNLKIADSQCYRVKIGIYFFKQNIGISPGFWLIKKKREMTFIIYKVGFKTIKAFFFQWKGGYHPLTSYFDGSYSSPGYGCSPHFFIKMTAKDVEQITQKAFIRSLSLWLWGDRDKSNYTQPVRSNLDVRVTDLDDIIQILTAHEGNGGKLLSRGETQP